MAHSAPSTVRFGNRQSSLAKIQAEGMPDSLRKPSEGWPFTTDAMCTLGDRDKITVLYNFEGKNLWTSVLQEKHTSREAEGRQRSM